MNTDTRWTLVLVTSLVLWLPALQGTLDGGLDLVAGAMRYLLALAAAWCGIGAVDRLIRGYERAGGRASRPESGVESAGLEGPSDSSGLRKSSSDAPSDPAYATRDAGAEAGLPAEERESDASPGPAPPAPPVPPAPPAPVPAAPAFARR